MKTKLVVAAILGIATVLFLWLYPPGADVNLSIVGGLVTFFGILNIPKF
jgi:hypothetical protein